METLDKIVRMHADKAISDIARIAISYYGYTLDEVRIALKRYIDSDMVPATPVDQA